MLKTNCESPKSKMQSKDQVISALTNGKMNDKFKHPMNKEIQLISNPAKHLRNRGSRVYTKNSTMSQNHQNHSPTKRKNGLVRIDEGNKLVVKKQTTASYNTTQAVNQKQPKGYAST